MAARAGQDEIRDLMGLTDGAAEIQNTLRVATPVVLAQIEALPT